MTRARIYQLPKSSMQSGFGNTRNWVLEFEMAEARRVEPLMGWVSNGDTRQQLRLFFNELEEATRYAESQGLAYEVAVAHERKIKPKAYADNFKFGRLENWTH